MVGRCVVINSQKGEKVDFHFPIGALVFFSFNEFLFFFSKSGRRDAEHRVRGVPAHDPRQEVHAQVQPPRRGHLKGDARVKSFNVVSSSIDLEFFCVFSASQSWTRKFTP